MEIAQRIRTSLRNPKIWQMALSIVIMAIISLAFFHPDAVEGNQLRQHDMQQGLAIGEETRAYQEATGEKSWWTNSLFSGMPTFQISPTYPSSSLYSWINRAYGLWLPAPSLWLMMMMMGFMILMMAMNVKWYYGLIGAVAWGLSTYFIIIIGAGHIWKFVTLSYIPPTIAGIIMAYRGRWIAGCAIAALFAMLQISANHVQMTYYFLFVILGLVIAFLVDAVRSHQMRRWSVATGALAVAGALAVCANSPSLYNTYEYSRETIRGGHSELATRGNDAASTDGGLDRNYITQYSYGAAETFSLFIPNIKGGASAKPEQGQMVALNLSDLERVAEMRANGSIDDLSAQYLQYVSQYFGEPEGTNGPVYVGVIIFMLFLLGCVIVKGPLKWALLVLTVISVLLALGRNCMWFTDLFIDYVPMYSKFRTVESILVIAEFTIPLLGVLALQKLLTAGNGGKEYLRPLMWSAGIVLFFCLLGIFAPGFYGKVVTPQDEAVSQNIMQQLLAGGYPREQVAAFSLDNPAIYQAVVTLRESMIEKDALRSFLFAALAAGLLYFYVRRKYPVWVPAAGIGLLVLIDLYTVNKRYLNHDSFCQPSVSQTDPFPMTAVDRAILADTAMNYRVMDIPRFWLPDPSYRHKAIGGYHAAKLTRYQDLIDRHIGGVVYGAPTEADLRVLDMLNAKYIIDRSGQVSLNPNALGNAWLVDELTFVDTPDREMDALSVIDPAVTAVADRKFADRLTAPAVKQPGDTVFETSYAPNRLTYNVNTRDGGLVVFSEIYFPYGWNVTVDGQPAELGRVDYVLRALNVPAGQHKVEMTFDPQSIKTTTTLATVSIVIIYLMVIAAIGHVLIMNPAGRKEEDA